MDFVIQWSCYLLAFLGGSAVAWVVVTTLSIKRASRDEGAAEAPSAAETGAQ